MLGVNVEWLGTKKGMESELIPQTGIPIHYISISGLMGRVHSQKYWRLLPLW